MSAAASRNGPENALVTARSSCSWRPFVERAPLVVVGPSFERALDVGELAELLGAVDLVEDVLRHAELVERRDVAVEHDGRARADRLVAVLLERAS